MTPGVLIDTQGSHQYRVEDRGLGGVPVQFSTTVNDVGQDLRSAGQPCQAAAFPAGWCPPGLRARSRLAPGGEFGEMPGCPLERATTAAPASSSCLLSPLLPV